METLRNAMMVLCGHWWVVLAAAFFLTFLFGFTAGMLPVRANGLFTRLALASFVLVFVTIHAVAVTAGFEKATDGWRWWFFGATLGIPLFFLLQPVSLHMSPWVTGTHAGKTASASTFLIVGKKHLLDGRERD